MKTKSKVKNPMANICADEKLQRNIAWSVACYQAEMNGEPKPDRDKWEEVRFVGLIPEIKHELRETKRALELVLLRKLATAFDEWLGLDAVLECIDTGCRGADHPANCPSARLLKCLTAWKEMRK